MAQQLIEGLTNMAAPEFSTKRIAISQATKQMVAVVGGAAAITIFCLVASKAVWSQNLYQARVLTAKQKAHKQLVRNIEAFGDLVKSYKTFDGKDTNVISGTKSGAGDNDGSNSKIILDALPSTYDFPALTSSIEKIINDHNLKVSGITPSL
jgi:hypothetical protein